MPITTPAPDAVVALTAAGVTVLTEVSEARLPAVVHWGAELPGLSADEAATLVAGSRELSGPNDVDRAVRLAVLPELATGWMGRPGLQGSRQGRSWSTRFTVIGARLDGRSVAGFATGGAGVLEVDAVDAGAGLELRLVLELLPTGLVRTRATVTNRTDDPFTVDGVALALPVPAEAGELLDFAGRWGRERAPQRLPFAVGTHLRENRKGRTGADSAYVLHAGTPGFGFANGEVYAVHTAFSGNHLHYAERTFNGSRLLGGGEVLLSGEVRLDRDESYTTPWVFGSYGIGLDAVAHRFHGHLRARTPKVSPERPVALNVWEAVYFEHDLDRLIDLAERAAAVGVERFVLDDGWFGGRRHDRAGLGDWVVSSEAWPDGLHPLVDHVHKLGMQFGLWFEPEMVNPDSDVAREHPEWVMAARQEWPIESRSQQVLNLAIPEAYDHVKNQMCAILDEYDIGYLKWDHNRDLVEAGNQLDAGRPAVHAQTLAVYRLLDELRAAYPGLEIESCSSGGARIDLEVLNRTDRVWGSDCIDPLERQFINRWTAQLIPLEYIGSHIASRRSHTTGRAHDLSFRAGTAIFGHLGIEWDLATASEQELTDLSAWVRFYQEHRGLLMSGDLVRMDGYDDSVLVHGVVAADRSEALFAMATVGVPEAQPGPRLRFRGLAPESIYRVRPVLVGTPPSGLRTPQWWGRELDFPVTDHANGHESAFTAEVPEFEGCLLSGAALERVGLTPPAVNPDQVVLFRATSVG